jgi:hypothetical protein
MNFATQIRSWPAVFFLLLLAACGGGGGDQNQGSASNSATLRWQPPTQREDGTPLTSVGGYTLYYGRDSSNLERAVHLGGSVTEYRVDFLERGTWYFAVSASDSNGVESRLSAMASKTIW